MSSPFFDDKEKPDARPLYVAARDGQKDLVELLIAMGLDVNAKDKDGETALYVAAWAGHQDVVELLISKGADVKARSRCKCQRGV